MDIQQIFGKSLGTNETCISSSGLSFLQHLNPVTYIPILRGFFRKGMSLLNKSAHWTGREGSSDVCALSLASHLLGVAPTSHSNASRLVIISCLLLLADCCSLSLSSPQSQMQLSPLDSSKHPSTVLLCQTDFPESFRI